MKRFLFLLILFPSVAWSLRRITLIDDDAYTSIDSNFRNITDEFANTVHKTSTETIRGFKTFSNFITATGGVVAGSSSNTIVDSTGRVLSTYVYGTQTNDNATAGFIGQYISSAVTTNTNYPATGAWGDLAQISLTAGDWDVTAICGATANGATVTEVNTGIGSTSGNNSPGTRGIAYINGVIPSATTDGGSSFGPTRISIGSTTTYYLKFRAAFSVATPQATGIISARRVR